MILPVYIYAILFPFACFTITFGVTRSPILSWFRGLVLWSARKVGGRWAEEKMTEVLSCWLCSGVWSSLFVYGVTSPLIHTSYSWSSYRLYAEAALFTGAGAAFVYVVGKTMDFLDDILELKGAQTIPSEVFDSVKSEIESNSGSS